jgi:hypothetical protein
MKDILLARGTYECVIKELNLEFRPLNFIGAAPKGVKLFEVAEDSE